MTKKILTLLFLVMWANDANAICIINRSQDTVAFVRGEPFAGMETYFTGTVRPSAQHCSRLSPRMDGTFPVSVYTLTRRGNCVVVRGCFYSSHAEQLFFNGSAGSACPVAFRDNTCS